ncbi:MAG: hypothetical protein JJE55_08240 [Flavobacteriaceae bacterium]|nr:hypothetical protein [Flavobacteriaceae bacterium]
MKDSTWTEVKYHKKDTTITIPGDVSYISLPISEITENPVKKSSGRSTATVSRSGDNIQVQCECAEFKQTISYLETEITHLREIIDLQKQISTVPVQFVPWYIKTLAWIGGAALVGVVFLIAKKLFLK